TLATPKIVIAGGTAGGLEGGIQVGDIAGAIATIYNDADATVFGYELGQIPRMPVDYHSSQRAIDALAGLNDAQPHHVRTGRIVTGDSFASEKVVARIRAGFPDALAVDMETCGMAQVCWSNGVDWICLRAISDLTGEGADEDFHMNGEKAAYHSFEAICAYLSLFCK
ncbi:MAG: 5'-methylthioadenosine/S-adenosylhomocysteine nucleosidase, partial [Trueperella pyogenes]|nr:5'-methylthioadenosine/S-adenosylhomocysteine nucleosidase [Trueperella pyogenes]